MKLIELSINKILLAKFYIVLPIATFRFFTIIYLILFFLNCQNVALENHCDPRSDKYGDLVILKTLLGDNDFSCNDPIELNRLLSFGFLGAQNGLNKDYYASIDGSTVSVSLPYAIVSLAKPTFNTFGNMVWFNGILVISNETSFD